MFIGQMQSNTAETEEILAWVGLCRLELSPNAQHMGHDRMPSDCCLVLQPAEYKRKRFLVLHDCRGRMDMALRQLVGRLD